MGESLTKKVLDWSASNADDDYVAINSFLKYLGDNLYYDYEPSFGPFPDYYARLNKWIENLPDEADQQVLLKLAKRIFYVGRDEFNSLNRNAFNNQTVRWLINQENVFFDDPFAVKKIKDGIRKCWFCPVTDSLRINQFYHVNQILDSHHEYRPDWKSLRKFGDPTRIKDYISKKKVEYLVLLEDFVGSATQSWETLKYACELDENLKVLFIPLIICPEGIKKIYKELNGLKNFTMKPVMKLSSDCFVPKDAVQDGDFNEASFRKLILSAEPFYKFGVEELKFGFEEMGCLLVMFTNTPTNSLPLIHYESENSNWSPLFKRHHRAKVWK